MRWGKRGHAARGYHHGNLKEALVRAALELIAEKGPAGFTFADAARWAGVSPAAPYRHYRDRDALLADVARRGFELFAAALAQAWDDGRPDVMTAFDRLGKTYLAFAKREPAYYSAMFEAGVPLDTDRELREASENAVARRRRETGHADAAARTSAGVDGCAACLGDDARHCVLVRTRRRGKAHLADAAGGIAGSCGADLPARTRPYHGSGKPSLKPREIPPQD
jgi:AcrR family transcriptional regulator